jgi:hypothetical protein
MTTTGKNRIMIFGPKDDGTYCRVQNGGERGAESRTARKAV